MPSAARVVVSLALGGSVLVCSFVSSLYLKTSSFRYTPSIQPQNVAFSIWGLIFLTGVLRSVLSLFRNTSTPLRDLSLGMHALSFLVSALWAPFFSQQRLRLSCLCLGTATLLSYASLILSNPLTSSDDFLVTLGVDLLAGWLTVAFGLCLVIAGLAPDDTSLLLLLIGGTSFVASVTSRPVLLAPVLWATLLQREYDSNVRIGVAILIMALLSSSFTLHRSL